MAVLASLGPIVAFFSVTTTSYPFVLLLNVLVFVVSAVLGFAFMWQTLHRLSAVRHVMSMPSSQRDALQGEQPTEGGGSRCGSEEPSMSVMAQLVGETGALGGVQGHVLDRHVKTVFLFWMMAAGLVGAQMAWVLRPFLGKPAEPFQWFSARESNFLLGLWNALQALFS